MIPNLDQLILVCLIAFAAAAGIVWLILRFTSGSDSASDNLSNNNADDK